MPGITDHSASGTVKMLLMGESGCGKTGSLMSLVAAGYKLRILDFDNNLSILHNYAIHPSSPYRDALKGIDLNDAVQYVTLEDHMKSINGRAVPSNAIAFGRAMQLLERWKDGDTDLGKPAAWGPEYVLVIDSLTSLSQAALNQAQAINGRLGSDKSGFDWQRDVGESQRALGKCIEWLCDKTFTPNVVVIAHIRYLLPEAENRATLREGDRPPPGLLKKGFPKTLGQALSPEIPTHFGNVLHAILEGEGKSERRKLSTVPNAGVPTKSSAPAAVKPSYDLHDGLAQYFAAVKSGAKSEPESVKPVATAA